MKAKEVRKSYQQHVRRKNIFILATAFSLLILTLVGISIGASGISITGVLKSFTSSADPVQQQIIFNIRLPRVLSAIICGIALAVSGTAMQSILRNPLGSPFTLGISNAAAFGAAFAVIVFGAGSMQSSANDSVLYNNPYIVTMSAFFWSLVSTLLILLVAHIKGATSENMILTGIITGSLFIALTTGLQYMADDVEIAAIVFWSFGDLSRASWNELLILFLIITPIFIYFIFNRWNYNVLDSGDEPARGLGVNVNKVRIWGMILASLATATAVSFFGIIAFVGLIVPHMVRRIIGSDERFLLPASALFGGAFLLFSDILARSIIAPMVLPVGIITSLVGAPVFIFLLLKGVGKSQW